MSLLLYDYCTSTVLLLYHYCTTVLHYYITTKLLLYHCTTVSPKTPRQSLPSESGSKFAGLLLKLEDLDSGGEGFVNQAITLYDIAIISVACKATVRTSQGQKE